jgi:hypothetical protein
MRQGEQSNPDFPQLRGCTIPDRVLHLLFSNILPVDVL